MTSLRSFLAIAWLFVTLLLWMRWDDHQRMQAAAALAGPEPVESPRSSLPGNLDLEAVPRPSTDASVPDLEAGSDTLPTVGAPTTTQAADWVTVRSDVLELAFDPQGGDLVRTRLLEYPEELDRPDVPISLLERTNQGLFVAQSGLVSAASPAPNHTMRWQAEQSSVELGARSGEVEFAFAWEDGEGLRVRKIYTLKRGSYEIGLRHEVQNGSAQAWTGAEYRQLMRTEPPPPGNSFTNPASFSFVGGSRYSPELKFQKFQFDEFGEAEYAGPLVGGWSAMVQHYYVAAWIPPSDRTEVYDSRVLQGPQPRYVISQVSPNVVLEPGGNGIFESRLFVGPKRQELLDAAAPGLRYTVDYGWVTVLAQPLFWLLKFFHGLFNNWGMAIIGVVLVVKLAFFKLSETQYRSMAKMRKFQPRIQALQERFGDDRQKMQQAMLELYKKEKINPLGGCLPILIQLPVFLALYWVLAESVEMRQAPFFGWIRDLAVRDPYFVLPVLNALVMYATQKLSPPPAGMDPIQAKILTSMPLVFAVLFAFFPAGLVLYWTVNGGLGLLQQWIITRRIEAGEKA